jgi:cytidylate kinase
MQIISISRGSFGYGKDLAEKLAAKLGYTCIGREMFTDEATDHGIPVGKVEMAVLKRRPLSEEMAVEVDRFKAFITASLCEKALSGGIVYHGRTGHLVLPGITHVMRVRAIADMEERIALAMNRLKLDRDKAKLYNEQVDEDIHRWVRVLYNTDWDDPSLYDITINAEHLSIENSASLLMQMAKLPEFEPSPASQQVVEDLLLASRCRLAIGGDKRTHPLKVTVHAEKGRVSVTSLPRQAKLAEDIPSVLERIEGIRSFVCTVATTNILFVQERFDPEAESLGDLIEVAEKWNAAVELVRLTDEVTGRDAASQKSVSAPDAKEYDGGILDESTSPPGAKQDRFGMPETTDKLIQVGRAGSSLTVYGGAQEMIKSLNLTEHYSLIVVGNLFLSKGESVRKRMTRDLASLLSDKFRIPVIGTEDLKKRYLFSPWDWLHLTGYAALAALIYILVFSFQEEILSFIQAVGTHRKLLVAGTIFAFIPIVSFIIGSFYRNLLKLIKLE